MKKSYSAGGVVISREGKVLVVNQHNNSWSLPKGHIDPGETAEQAAVREVREESGISGLQLVRKLGVYDRHRIGKHGIGEDMTDLKYIQIFLFTTSQTAIAPEDPDNPEAKWVKPQKVTALLTHPKDAAFYQSVLSEIENFIGKIDDEFASGNS